MNSCVENDSRIGQHAVIPGPRVQVDGVARVPVPGAHTEAQPKVELIRAGNVIRAIDVTCTCGRRIRLRCNYTE